MRRLALVLVACLAGSAAAQPVPLLWEVADADSRVWLLGSIHLLTAADYPLAPAVEAAYAEAEAVAFELDLATMEAEAMRALPRYGFAADGRTLADRLPADTYAALEALLAARGLPAGAFDTMRPWLVSMAVAELTLAGSALRAEHGVDRHFHDRAVADGRERIALETADQQFAALASVPDADQVAALADALASADAAAAKLDTLVGLWRRGDADALARFVADETAHQPGASKRLLAARNRTWLVPIETLLARTGDDVLVVVGAAHLVGPDSVPALLEARGYAVRRVDGP